MVAVMIPQAAWAQRPSAPQLLPESTGLLVRIHNVTELRERFSETSIGQISSDPQIKPLVSDVFKALSEAFGPVQDRLGTSLAELLEIPQGELSIALIVPENGRISFVVMADVGEQLPTAEKVLNRIREQSPALAREPIVERVGATELRVFANRGAAREEDSDDNEQRTEGNQNRRRRVRGRGPSEVCLFERDGVLSIGDSREVAKSILAAWDGESVPTLASNARFSTIMDRCTNDKDGNPQVTWYVDPITLIQRAIQGNFPAQAVFSVLSQLGISGVKGVGGSMIFATEEYDTIAHYHLSLDNPRTGVLEVIAIREGDATPEPWVPNDVASYSTLFWDANKTYDAVGKVYDTFRGEGAWSNDVKERGSQSLGVDIETELLPALDGRFSYVQWIERPIVFNSQVSLVGIRLKDVDSFQALLDRVVSRFASQVETRNVRGTKIYHTNRQQPQFEGVRPQQECAAIVGDYLLLSNSMKLLEHAIATENDSSGSLADELDYKLIANKIGRQVGGKKPGMLTFNRPEEGMRAMYELALSDFTKQRLGQLGQNNPVLGNLDRALKENPLPPFEVIAKYLAPGGGYVTSDDTGIHYMGFSLRRK